MNEEFFPIRPRGSARKTPSCPDEIVWLEVVAGLHPDPEAQLSHAVHCDYCGPRLLEATTDLMGDLSPAEQELFETLMQARPDGHKILATRMTAASQPAGAAAPRAIPARSTVKSHRRTLPLFRYLALAATVAVAVWVGIRFTRPADANQLVASAYAEQRTLETQFAGIPYAPLRQNKGPASRMQRPALLKAEAAIAAKLARDPENVAWLQASGRTSLLEGDPQSAMDVLQKAQRLDKDNASVGIDLAGAYMLRGKMQQRGDDAAQAVEILGQVLFNDPHNQAAQFNLALAKESSPAFRQGAIAAWELFLREHGNSDWAPEAKEHLEALLQQTQAREQRMQRPLEPPEALARLAASGDSRGPGTDIGTDIDPGIDTAIDARVEDYQELAIKEWLPQRFSPETPAAKATALHNALLTLANLLSQHHQDPWLHDLLTTHQASRQFPQAVQSLAESERLIASSADERALAAAARANLGFRQAGSEAGMARAQFDIVLIDQLLHHSRECLAQDAQLTSTAAAHGYAWLLIQSRLEASVCASMDDAAAMHSARQALEDTRTHHFPALELRALTFVSDLYATLGDTQAAWAAGADGLRAYWAGAAPALRGYSLLDTLDEVAQQRQQWFLAAALLNESIPMIAHDPDLAMRAFEQARLGQALLKAGDLDSAELHFRASQDLFAKVPAGSRRRMLSAEAEVGLARAEIQRGNPQSAAQRLALARDTVTAATLDDLRLDYSLTNGIALMRSGHAAEADTQLHAALDLAEKGLRLVSTDEDRLQWSGRNEAVYRALVELNLQTNPQAALAYWEAYRGAAIRGRTPAMPRLLRASVTPAETNPAPPLAAQNLDSDTAAITFVVFPRGVAVWVASSLAGKQSLHGQWIALPRAELEQQVHRLAERCSDPGSNLEALRHDSAALYQKLFAPMEPFTRNYPRLILEPDGVLSLVPFAALVDAQGNYLGDKHALTLSLGLDYLALARPWTGLSPESTALVIGNPAVEGWASLPEAEHEARTVAAHFHHPELLLGGQIQNVNLVTAVRKAEVIHFSGHATASATNAGMVLDDQGLWNAARMRSSLSNRNALVILSACDSARGTTGAYNDRDSGVRTLLGAGIPEVIASNWPVDSTATAVLMNGLYDQLFAGQTPSQSLKQAAMELRKDPRYAHPYYWAAFGTYGKG